MRKELSPSWFLSKALSSGTRKGEGQLDSEKPTLCEKRKSIHNSNREKTKLKPASVDTQPEDIILYLTMYTAQVTHRQGWEWGQGTQENKPVNCAPGDARGFLCPGLYDRSSVIDYYSEEYSTSPGTGHPSFCNSANSINMRFIFMSFS